MRHLVRLLTPLALFAICSTNLLAAEPRLKLNENLKPLEKFLGKWESEMVNEKGEKQTSRTVFEVAGGGNAIIGHSQNQGSIWFWYYNSETKKIVTMAINGSGRVDKGQNPAEIFNNAEVDTIDTYTTLDGKQGVEIEHLKWTDKDTFVMWATNEFLEGKKQPDGPKVTAKRAKE